MWKAYRYELIAGAVILLVALAVGLRTWPITPPLQSYGEEQPRDTKYRPGGSACEPAALIKLGREAGVRAADACRREAEEFRQKTNDLIQQTRSANAAEAQTEVSNQALWMLWFQTLGGFLTLFAAIGAALYARRAAVATEATAEVTLAHSKPEVEITGNVHLQPRGADDTIQELGISARNSGYGSALGFEIRQAKLTVEGCFDDLELNGVPGPDEPRDLTDMGAGYRFPIPLEKLNNVTARDGAYSGRVVRAEITYWYRTVLGAFVEVRGNWSGRFVENRTANGEIADVEAHLIRVG
jgi:hypothetical protein